MTAIDSGVGVGLVEPSSVGKEVAEASTSGAGGEGGGRPIALGRAGILEVKDTDFRVSGASHDALVSAVWHELDREDVGMMTCADTGVQGEGFS